MYRTKSNNYEKEITFYQFHFLLVLCFLQEDTWFFLMLKQCFKCTNQAFNYSYTRYHRQEKQSRVVIDFRDTCNLLFLQEYGITN